MTHIFWLKLVQVQIVELCVQSLFFLIDVLELLGDDLAGFVGLDIESLEVEHDGADVALQIFPHFLLPAERLLVLIHLLDQLFFLLAGQVVDVALNFLDPPRDFYLELPVLCLHVH